MDNNFSRLIWNYTRSSKVHTSLLDIEVWNEVCLHMHWSPDVCLLTARIESSEAVFRDRKEDKLNRLCGETIKTWNKDSASKPGGWLALLARDDIWPPSIFSASTFIRLTYHPCRMYSIVVVPGYLLFSVVRKFLLSASFSSLACLLCPPPHILSHFLAHCILWTTCSVLINLPFFLFLSVSICFLYRLPIYQVSRKQQIMTKPTNMLIV